VIRGLTTAAGLWTVAAIGLAAGGGMYYAAWIATFIVVIILWLLKPLEKRIFRKYRVQVIRLTIDPDAGQAITTALEELIAVENLEFIGLTLERNTRGSFIVLRFSNKGAGDLMIGLIGKLQSLPVIREVYWDKGN
jgi:putative Mg2+ transporter-C (MgtC) family protein